MQAGVLGTITTATDKSPMGLLWFREDNYTRGHRFKLFKKRSRLEIRKQSFFYRILDIWNSLPESVVESPSIKTFENHIDKHLKKLPIKYEY